MRAQCGYTTVEFTKDIPLTKWLDRFGNISGALGAGVCVLAVLCRFVLERRADMKGILPNILIIGIALMAFGCWLKLSKK